MPRFAPYGFLRGLFNFQVDSLTGTSAKEFLTDYTPGFRGTVEKVTAVVKIAGTGAGASQTVRLVKGASTVIATATVTLAATGTLGATIAFTVTDADADFDDTDTLTLDMTGGGTAFTAGALQVLVQYRQRPQREAS